MATFDDLVERTWHRVSELAPDGQQPLYDEDITGDEIRAAARIVQRRTPKRVQVTLASDFLAQANDAQYHRVKDETTRVEVPDRHANAGFLPMIDIFRVKCDGWVNAAGSLGQLYDPVPDEADVNAPFCALRFATGDTSPELMEVMCYPKSTSTTTPFTEFIYLPEVSPEALPEVMIDAVCWNAAQRLLASDKDWMRMAPVAERQYELAMSEILGMRTSKRRTRRPSHAY